MLALSRKQGESIMIGGNIEITVLEITKERVKIGISAPKDVNIIRSELRDAQNANRESSEAVSPDAIQALLKLKENQGV